VPAVLRYNRIPNRVLLEIANLGNEEDRALTVTRAFRRRVADAIVAGLLDFFGAVSGAASNRSRVVEARGPWPEMYGPPSPYRSSAPKAPKPPKRPPSKPLRRSRPK